MVKFAALSLSVLCLTATTASAEILFRGSMRITAVSAGCTGVVGVNNQWNAQFHPATAPGNDNWSALNRIDQYGAQSYRKLTAGAFTASFQRVSNNGIGWSDYTPSKPTFVSVSVQTPGTIKATTVGVSLTGQIKNIFGDSGSAENCVASFAFAGVKSPQ